MVRQVDNFDLRGAFNYLVEDQDEGGMGLTRPQAENQIGAAPPTLRRIPVAVKYVVGKQQSGSSLQKMR